MTVANSTISGNSANEPDEQFYVNISSAVNAVVMGPEGVVTILNDDTNPSGGSLATYLPIMSKGP